MLLDTHTLLWFLDDNPRLPPEVKELIESADRVAVSIVTIWEIAIKELLLCQLPDSRM